MFFDRFDIVSAYYAYACDYYCGQADPLYALQGYLANVIQFRPGRSWKGYDGLTDNGKAIYDRLVSDDYNGIRTKDYA